MSSTLSLAKHLSLNVLLDFDSLSVRPSDIERMNKKANIWSIGDVERFVPSDMSKITGIDEEHCRKIINCCSSMIQEASSRSYKSALSSSTLIKKIGDGSETEEEDDADPDSPSGTMSDTSKVSVFGPGCMKSLRQILQEKTHTNCFSPSFGTAPSSGNFISPFRPSGISTVDELLGISDAGGGRGRGGGGGGGGGGGFPHGSISEIFGLPGCGKTQLVMQIAAASTLPANEFFHGLPRILVAVAGESHNQPNRNHTSVVTPPILVIDTEGSWSNERVACICDAFSKMIQTTKEEMEKRSRPDEMNSSPSFFDYDPREALNRIQFFRTTDLATVCSALYLFREQVLRQRRELMSSMPKRQRNSNTANNSNNDSNNEQQFASDAVINSYGGLVIIDSIAALMKENRINDNSLHRSTFLSADGGSGGSTSASSVANNQTSGNFHNSGNNSGPNLFAANNNSVAKTQTVAAFSRLLQSIATETNSAVIVTNQMIKKTNLPTPANINNSNNNNNNSNNFGRNGSSHSNSTITSYVPALGEVWSNVPALRVSIKKIPGTHFTSQSRIFSVVRGKFLALSRTVSCSSTSSSDASDFVFSNYFRTLANDGSANNASAEIQTCSSCQFRIEEELLRAVVLDDDDDDDDEDGCGKHDENRIPRQQQQQLPPTSNTNLMDQIETEAPQRRDRFGEHVDESTSIATADDHKQQQSVGIHKLSGFFSKRR